MVRSRGKPETGPLVAMWVLFFGLAVAAVPLATDPAMPLRLVLLGAGLGIALWLNSPANLPRSAGWALAACLGVFAVAAVAGETPLLSLVGRYPRYEGLPLVAAYAVAVWVGARLLSGESPKMRTVATSALAVGVIANAMVGLGQLVAGTSDRISGLMGNATTLGTLGVLALALLGWKCVETPRPLLVAGAASAGICVVISGSRGAVLGVVAMALAATVVLGARWSRAGQRWWTPGAVALAVVGVALAVPSSGSRLTGASPFAESTITGRWQLWGETLALLADRPVLGVGPSRFVDSIGAHHTAQWAATVGPYAPPDSPHSLLLQVASAAGLVGVAAFIALAGVIAWLLLGRRPWDAWQAGAVTAGIGVIAVYSTSFTDLTTTTLLALVVGGAIGIKAADPHATGGAVGALAVWARRLTAVLLGASLSVLGATGLVAEARYSAALKAQDPGPVLLSVLGSRPWDADLDRRVGYTLVRFAEAGQVDPAAAVQVLSQACPRLPGSAECLQSLADAQSLAGDQGAALATLRQATQADPTNVDTALRVGVVLAESGSYQEAEEAFRRAADLRPTAPEPWENLAYLYELTGSEAESLTAQQKAEALKQG